MIIWSINTLSVVLALIAAAALLALVPVAAQDSTGTSEAGEKAGNTAESSSKSVNEDEDKPTGEDATEETGTGAGAGNVADAAGTAEVEPAVPDETQAPVETGAEETPAAGLTGSDLSDLGFDLPDFADDQPGFIPDLAPTDLLEERTDIAGFRTYLGPSRLPRDEVRDTILRHQGMPERDLSDNFARIIVNPGGTIEGSTETKQFHIEGGLQIYYSQIVIAGDSADIDEKNEVAVLRGNVSIDDPKYTMEADELLIYFEDKRFLASGFVQFKKRSESASGEPDLGLAKKDRLREHFAGQEFELFCKDLFYDWDSKSMTASDSVRLKHPVFNGSMDRLDYNDTTKEYELTGEITLEVTEYGWVFENELVEGDDVQKVEALTDGSTRITCDQVIYSEENGVAQFYARPEKDVTFVQPTRNIAASYIEVNDETKDFHAESVEGKKVRYSQDDGEWMFAGGLVDREGVDEDMAEALGGPLETTSQTLTYNFDRKRLELLDGVTIIAGSRTIEAGEVIQDETAKFFLMRQNVHIKPDADSEIVAAQVYIDTENDIVTLIGMVQGKLKSEDLPLQGDAAGTGRGGQAGDSEFEAASGVFRQQSSVETEKNSSNVAEGG